MKVLKHQWFPKVKDLLSFAEASMLQKGDIVHTSKNPDGSWEMLYFSKDDGHKQDIGI